MTGRIMAMEWVGFRVWERWKAWRDVVFLTGATAIYALLSLSLLLRVPGSHPDEAYIAQAALSLVRDGVMATPSLAEIIPSFGEHTFWYPPAHFLALAADFKVLGFGLVQLRLFSVLMGLVAVVFLFLALRRVSRNWWPVAAATVVVVTDPTYLEACRTGRMETMTMAAVCVGAYCYVRSLNQARGSSYWVGLAGTFVAVAWLTHPLGLALAAAVFLSELMVAVECRRIDVHRLALLAVPSLVGGLAWLLYIAQDLNGFREQMEMQAMTHPHGLTLGYVPHVLRSYHPEFVPIFLTYVLLAFFALVLHARRASPSGRFLAVLFVLGVVMALYGVATRAYLAYLSLYGAGSLALVMSRVPITRLGMRLPLLAVIALASGILLMNVAVDSYLIQKYRVRIAAETDSLRLSRDVDALIPDDQRIVLATSASFFEMARHRELRDLIMLPRGHEDELRQALETSDYIVTGVRGGVSLVPESYPTIVKFVEARGELVGTVGYECSSCAIYRVWKVVPAADAAQAGEPATARDE